MSKAKTLQEVEIKGPVEFDSLVEKFSNIESYLPVSFPKSASVRSSEYISALQLIVSAFKTAFDQFSEAKFFTNTNGKYYTNVNSTSERSHRNKSGTAGVQAHICYGKLNNPNLVESKIEQVLEDVNTEVGDSPDSFPVLDLEDITRAYIKCKIMVVMLCGCSIDFEAIQHVKGLLSSADNFTLDVSQHRKKLNNAAVRDKIPFFSLDGLCKLFFDFQLSKFHNLKEVKSVIASKKADIKRSECDDYKMFKEKFGSDPPFSMTTEPIKFEKSGKTMCLKYLLFKTDCVPTLLISKAGVNIRKCLLAEICSQENSRTNNTDQSTAIVELVITKGRVSVTDLHEALSDRSSVFSLHESIMPLSAFEVVPLRCPVRAQLYIDIKRNLCDLICLPNTVADFSYIKAIRQFFLMMDLPEMSSKFSDSKRYPVLDLSEINNLAEINTVSCRNTTKIEEVIPPIRKILIRCLAGICIEEDMKIVDDDRKKSGCRCGLLYDGCFCPLDCAIIAFAYSICPFCKGKITSLRTVNTRHVNTNAFEQSQLLKLHSKYNIGTDEYHSAGSNSYCKMTRVSDDHIMQQRPDCLDKNPFSVNFADNDQIEIVSDCFKAIRLRDECSYTFTDNIKDANALYMNPNYEIKGVAIHEASSPDVGGVDISLLAIDDGDKFLDKSDDLVKPYVTTILPFQRTSAPERSFFGKLLDFTLGECDQGLERNISNSLVVVSPDHPNDPLTNFIRLVDQNYKNANKCIEKFHDTAYPEFSILSGLMKYSHYTMFKSRSGLSHITRDLTLSLLFSDSVSQTIKTTNGNSPIFPRVVMKGRNITPCFYTSLIISDLPPGYFVPLQHEIQLISTESESVLESVKGCFCGVYIHDPNMTECVVAMSLDNFIFQVELIISVMSHSAQSVHFSNSYLYCPRHTNYTHSLYFENGMQLKFLIKSEEIEILFRGARSSANSIGGRPKCGMTSTDKEVMSSAIEDMNDYLQVLCYSLNYIICKLANTTMSELLLTLMFHSVSTRGITINDSRLNSHICYGAYVMTVSGAPPTTLVMRNWPQRVAPLQISKRNSILFKLALEFGVSKLSLRPLLQKKDHLLEWEKFFISNDINPIFKYEIDLPQIEYKNGNYLTLALMNEELKREGSHNFADFLTPDKDNQIVIDKKCLNSIEGVSATKNSSFIFSPLWDAISYTKENGANMLQSYSIPSELPSFEKRHHYIGEKKVETHFRRNAVNSTNFTSKLVSIERYVLDNNLPQPSVNEALKSLLTKLRKPEVNDNDAVFDMVENKYFPTLQQSWTVDVDHSTDEPTLTPNIHAVCGDKVYYPKFESKVLPVFNPLVAVIATTVPEKRAINKFDQNLPYCLYTLVGNHTFGKLLSIGKRIYEYFTFDNYIGKDISGSVIKRAICSFTLRNLKKMLLTGKVVPQLLIALWSTTLDKCMGLEVRGIVGIPYGVTATASTEIYLRGKAHEADGCIPYDISDIITGRVSINIGKKSNTVTLYIKSETIPFGLKPSFASTQKDIEDCEYSGRYTVHSSTESDKVSIDTEIVSRRVFFLCDELESVATMLNAAGSLSPKEGEVISKAVSILKAVILEKNSDNENFTIEMDSEEAIKKKALLKKMLKRDKKTGLADPGTVLDEMRRESRDQSDDQIVENEENESQNAAIVKDESVNIDRVLPFEADSCCTAATSTLQGEDKLTSHDTNPKEDKLNNNDNISQGEVHRNSGKVKWTKNPALLNAVSKVDEKLKNEDKYGVIQMLTNAKSGIFDRIKFPDKTYRKIDLYNVYINYYRKFRPQKWAVDYCDFWPAFPLHNPYNIGYWIITAREVGTEKARELYNKYIEKLGVPEPEVVNSNGPIYRDSTDDYRIDNIGYGITMDERILYTVSNGCIVPSYFARDCIESMFQRNPITETRENRESSTEQSSGTSSESSNSSDSTDEESSCSEESTSTSGSASQSSTQDGSKLDDSMCSSVASSEISDERVARIVSLVNRTYISSKTDTVVSLLEPVIGEPMIMTAHSHILLNKKYKKKTRRQQILERFGDLVEQNRYTYVCDATYDKDNMQTESVSSLSQLSISQENIAYMAGSSDPSVKTSGQTSVSVSSSTVRTECTYKERIESMKEALKVREQFRNRLRNQRNRDV